RYYVADGRRRSPKQRAPRTLARPRRPEESDRQGPALLGRRPAPGRRPRRRQPHPPTPRPVPHPGRARRARLATRSDRMTRCTIAFQPEAYDSAATVLRSIQGYTVTVLPREDVKFDPKLHTITVGEDGQYKAVFWRWNEETDQADRSKIVELDIYDEIE